MSSPKLNVLMLREFLLGDQISSHDGITCYPAIKRGTDEKYILKVLSIPASQSKVEALLLAGAMTGKEAALAYFHRLARDLEAQTEILRNLSQQEGFAPYLDCCITPMEGDVGYHVYLLGTYKRSLERIFQSDALTHADVANLGLDLCAALAACRRSGYLFADLKPGNIFRDLEHGFRIGDVGFISLASLKYASLPEKYRSSYTAPEMLDDMAVLNTTVDIYALGLVLYQAYNGGTLPFSGHAPEEVLPHPMYADYEMADIILKACHPDPQKRWQDPTKMAQAIIDYLQNYGAAETPIIPPVAEMPEEAEPEEAEPFLPEADDQQLQRELDDLENADPDELAFLAGLVSDETAPSEENTADVPDNIMTQELSEMFAQADELIDHALPAPAVAPEPIFAPMPEPIPLEPEPTAEEMAVEMVTEDAAEDPQTMTEPTMEAETEESVSAPSEEPVSSPEETEAFAEIRKFPRLPRRLVAIAAIAVLVILLWNVGQRYYKDEYLLQVQHMQLQQQQNTLKVLVQSDIADGLLYVVCTDSYGNSIPSPVVGGVATITDLNPGTRYTVHLEVNGFHKLTGHTSDSFSTPAQTQVHSFVAGMGPEDCSVSLNFTVSGPENDHWTVHYTAEGEDSKSLTFTGRSVVVRDLVAGKHYTFTLSSDGGLYLAGKTQVDYVATNILYAQGLTITACGGGRVSVQWLPSEDGNVQQWHVRCFNEAGFDQTIVTSDLSHTFTGLDHSTACTVEVTAAGMPAGVSTSISANPVSIVDFRLSFTEDMAVLVQWLPVSQIPVEDWVLRCVLDSGEELVMHVQDHQVLMLALPGETYHFTLQTADGNYIFNGSHTFTVQDVAEFCGYGLTRGDLSAILSLLPEGDQWTMDDFPEDSATDRLVLGLHYALVLRSGILPEFSSNLVRVQFVLHDAGGKLLGISEQTVEWNDLLGSGGSILPVPDLPQTEGDYILTLYLDGMFALRQDFSMVAPPPVEDPEIGEPQT